jgi:hypothetical protein
MLRAWLSALKVLLDPGRQTLDNRLQQRWQQGSHFMPPTLLQSQLDALEYEESELLLHVKPGSCLVDQAGNIRVNGGSDGDMAGRSTGGFPSPQAIVQMILDRSKQKPGEY